MNKALFLDRDGVLNFGIKGSGYTYLVEDFFLLEHSIPTLKKYQDNDGVRTHTLYVAACTYTYYVCGCLCSLIGMRYHN